MWAVSVTAPSSKRSPAALQPMQSQRRMVSGESHFFMGLRYRLRVIEHQEAARVALRGKTALDLFVRPDTSSGGL